MDVAVLVFLDERVDRDVAEVVEVVEDLRSLLRARLEELDFELELLKEFDLLRKGRVRGRKMLSNMFAGEV